jgi:hypothetical protein
MLEPITVTVKQIGENLYNFPLFNVDFSIKKYKNKYSLVIENQHFIKGLKETFIIPRYSVFCKSKDVHIVHIMKALLIENSWILDKDHLILDAKK